MLVPTGRRAKIRLRKYRKDDYQSSADTISQRVVRGAGVRWTPLHFYAEAPTEPAGETADPYGCLTVTDL